MRARPTLYKGIRMRSRLEASFAQRCDQEHLAWKYEPDCFASEDGQYLPDFRLGDRRPYLYVEVKPYINQTVTRDVAQRMAIILRSEPDAQLELWTPEGSVRPHKGDWYTDNGTIPIVLSEDWEWARGEHNPRCALGSWRQKATSRPTRPFEGCHPVPDSDGGYYQADDPERPF